MAESSIPVKLLRTKSGTTVELDLGNYGKFYIHPAIAKALGERLIAAANTEVPVDPNTLYSGEVCMSSGSLFIRSDDVGSTQLQMLPAVSDVQKPTNKIGFRTT